MTHPDADVTPDDLPPDPIDPDDPLGPATPPLSAFQEAELERIAEEDDEYVEDIEKQPVPHPSHHRVYAAALNQGKKDPIAAARLTAESVVQHFKDMASAYEVLITKQGPKHNRHREMRELFAEKREAVEREMKWLDQVVTQALRSPAHIKPLLARIGTDRGIRSKVTPQHVLALQQLGFTPAEASALCRLNVATHGKWLRKAMIDVEKAYKGNARLPGMAPTQAFLPTAPTPQDGDGGEQKPSTVPEEVLNDPVARMKYTTKELLEAAKDMADPKVRFLHLAKLNDNAQKEVSRETERVAEEAIALLQMLPHMIERIEKATDAWRQEIERDLHADVAPLNVRDEAKAALLGFGAMGAEAQKMVEAL
jgi:hypothetical protein